MTVTTTGTTREPEEKARQLVGFQYGVSPESRRVIDRALNNQPDVRDLFAGV